MLQKKLGTEFRVIEEGLCGRTTVFQDEFREGRRGVDAIGTIVETHNPIDVLIIMLGTNDCKSRYGASAGIIAKGLEQIIVKAREKSSQKFKLLVISPIHLGKGVGDEAFDPEFDSDSERVSLNLAKEYKKVSEANDVVFLDASTYATPSSIDREHMDEAGHQALADGIFNILQKNYTDFSLD